jgi:hypothetical protein
MATGPVLFGAGGASPWVPCANTGIDPNRIIDASSTPRRIVWKPTVIIFPPAYSCAPFSVRPSTLTITAYRLLSRFSAHRNIDGHHSSLLSVHAVECAWSPHDAWIARRRQLQPLKYVYGAFFPRFHLLSRQILPATERGLSGIPHKKRVLSAQTRTACKKITLEIAKIMKARTVVSLGTS